jgi:hypothetical protein
MTIGRTEDPENPVVPSAFEVDVLFGSGSRNPSGPAVIAPRQQAGHMTAVDPHVIFRVDALEPTGPSTQARPHRIPRCLPLNVLGVPTRMTVTVRQAETFPTLPPGFT